MSKKPVVLCILDGWGIPEDGKYSAIAKANTPNYDAYLKNYPNSQLQASGEFVGLPDGQMGNSEVGHMNIGAGRVVFQSLPMIDRDVKNNTLKDRPVIKETIKNLKGVLHLIGLLSDGGVHSHISHIINIANVFKQLGIVVRLHVILDGRDVSQKSALDFISQVEGIEIATVGGRYYGMDRDKNWDRIQKHYEAIVNGDGVVFKSAVDVVNNGYENNITDEFIVPAVIEGYKGAVDGDGFIFCNFRADRARQITEALASSDFDGFKRELVKWSAKCQMTEYSLEHNRYLSTIYTPDNITNSLGEVISNKGLKQYRTAETEKYPHVTFFFNGGVEKQFEGEDRKIIPSPKVATYDLQPEMSANGVCDSVLDALDSEDYDLIVVNFANPDMVGHTGIMEAAVKAIEEVDKDIGKIVKKIQDKNGVILITADHGNAEKMFDDATGQPFTAHTTNPVPLIVIGESGNLNDGSLCDIAPTILKIMGIEQPKEMTGKNLIQHI
ncbi:MAG: 2,3-bisphosphoglycerate-independent phosphoglycerate mutase [Rickettsiales bacterium]|jgi:2,3-bisphosphoglycerate-independent phosphoglycerate mutase|nr:2,3-bisphosphoglycerate-independent phosphoglycerate mutase [Rickettsiales bacterium]